MALSRRREGHMRGHGGCFPSVSHRHTLVVTRMPQGI